MLRFALNGKNGKIHCTVRSAKMPFILLFFQRKTSMVRLRYGNVSYSLDVLYIEFFSFTKCRAENGYFSSWNTKNEMVFRKTPL